MNDDTLIEAARRDPGAVCALALERAGRGELDLAARLWRAVLGAHPGHAEAAAHLPAAIRGLLTAGFGHHRAGRPEEAESHYRAVLRSDPDNADALHLLALIVGPRDRAEADALYEAALAARPDFADALYNRGRFLITTERFAAAVPVLRRLLEIDPQRPEAPNFLGMALKGAGRGREAAPWFRRMLRLDPGHVEARLSHGAAREIAGRAAEAIQAYRVAAALQPGLDSPHFMLGHALLKLGRPGDAAGPLGRSDRVAPGDHRNALSLGMVLEALEDRDGAEAAYARATRLCPSSGENFTLHALLRLRHAFAWPEKPRLTAAAGPRVVMSTLGRNGRFGNSILQYAFLRLYAAEYGMAYEVPDWVGRYLFDGNDPWPSAPLSVLHEADARFEDSLARRIPLVYRNYDLLGHFCYPTAAMARHRRLFRDMLSPNPVLRPRLDLAMERLRGMGRTVVAAHLRRGDFGQGPFWIAPEAWYQAWLEEHWAGLDAPVLYLATDEPALVEAFGRYRPVTLADLGVPLPGAEFYLDFHVLSRADLMLISNSTFSFTASMLNAARDGGEARRFLRPDRDRRCLVPYDPWDADPPQVFRPPAGPAPRDSTGHGPASA